MGLTHGKKSSVTTAKSRNFGILGSTGFSNLLNADQKSLWRQDWNVLPRVHNNQVQVVGHHYLCAYSECPREKFISFQITEILDYLSHIYQS